MREIRPAVLLSTVVLGLSMLVLATSAGAATQTFQLPGAPGAMAPISPREIREATPMVLPPTPSTASAIPHATRPSATSGSRERSVPSRRPARAPRQFEDDIDGEHTIPVSGRLIARYRGGSFSCSGTVINTDSLSLVVTAGHCVIDGRRRWARSYTFVPGYDYGSAPYGVFYSKQAWVKTAYFRHFNPRFDYGVIAFGRNNSGQSLVEAAGGAGFSVNYPRAGYYRINGYPAGANRTRELRSCFDNTWAGPARIGGYVDFGPLSFSASCDMARGSSGGGWFRDSQSADGYVLNGVTSTGDRYFTRLTSPYFNNATWNLIFSADDAS